MPFHRGASLSPEIRIGDLERNRGILLEFEQRAKSHHPSIE